METLKDLCSAYIDAEKRLFALQEFRDGMPESGSDMKISVDMAWSASSNPVANNIVCYDLRRYIAGGIHSFVDTLIVDARAKVQECSKAISDFYAAGGS